MPASAAEETVDTALVVAVDVSGSVSPERYRLQIEGIAAAFEDAAVQRALLSGPNRATAVVLIEWSDKPQVSVPWTRIAAIEDARALAARVRTLARSAAQFTCMAQMLGFVSDKVLPLLPMAAARIVLDVSGDGPENCNPPVPVDAIRDALIAEQVTINGLPILAEGAAPGVDRWYEAHVIGGPGAFLMPAAGFADFARAVRHKFLLEISAAE
jgi:hypothetical protein